MSTAIRQRQTSDGPWCWLGKSALRHINKTIDNIGEVASARSVYVALAQIASDESKETFTTTVAHIANVSGIKDRTVRKRLQDLEKLGLIYTKRTALKAPSEYSLLAFGNNDLSTIGNNNRTFGNDASHRPMPTVEEQSEEKIEEREKGLAPSAIDVNAEAIRIGLTEEDAKGFYSYYQARGWLLSGSGKPVDDWKALLESWKLKKAKFAGGNGAHEQPVYVKPKPPDPIPEYDPITNTYFTPKRET